MKKELLFRRTRRPRAKASPSPSPKAGAARPALYGTIPNDLHALEKVFAKLKKAHPGAELRVCYEAGPTGFVLARRCAQLQDRLHGRGARR